MRASVTAGLLLLLLGTATAAPSGAARPIDLIADDYAKAAALAAARKLPLFVDVGAPWCHSCRYLQAYVLTDPLLAKVAKKFIWLSLDTEVAANGDFLTRHPVDALPTLFVLDGGSDKVLWRSVGLLDAAQLVKALSRVAARRGGDLQRAEELRQAGDLAGASAAYRLALPKLPEDERGAVVGALLTLWAMNGKGERCVKEARELLPTLPKDAAWASDVATALSCTEGLSPAARTAALAELEPLAEQALALPAMLADDRSGLYGELVDLKEKAHDPAGQQVWAERWLVFLEKEAAAAKSPAQRTAFDPHRVNAALALGQPLRAEAALLLSEKEDPADYNPPARLALVYQAAGRHKEALAAIGRALERAHGPRALRFYETKAELQGAAGDRAGARATLEEARRFASALPPAQKPERHVSRIDALLRKLP